jgi:CoA-transferase family III
MLRKMALKTYRKYAQPDFGPSLGSRTSVVTRISGFAQTSPLSDKLCFDVIAQITSRLMDISGDADSRPTMAGAYRTSRGSVSADRG